MREYPRQPGEHQLHYIARIAFESGLTADHEGIKSFPGVPVARRPEQVRGYEDLRLPYKDSPDEDEVAL